MSFMSLSLWVVWFRVAVSCEKESSYYLSLKEAFRERAIYGGQQQAKKVVEPTHISKHHKDVVDDSFLVLNFVWNVDLYWVEFVFGGWFIGISIEVEITDFFWRSEPHEVELIIVELCSIFV